MGLSPLFSKGVSLRQWKGSRGAIWVSKGLVCVEKVTSLRPGLELNTRTLPEVKRARPHAGKRSVHAG